MLGFSPKLPVTEEDRRWADEGFLRLEKLLGRRRMLEANQVLPDAEHFPDPYDKTPAAAEVLFERVCSYMRVDRSRIELEVFADETDELREILPYWRGGTGGCAGLYTHDAPGPGSDTTENGPREAAGMVVALRSSQLKDPLTLVATMAHELGHVILLGGGLMDPKTPDHEPMTDLLTVFLGLGIFTANSAGRFKQYQDERRQGWSMQRLGYLPEEVFGYALARFAHKREEEKPAWAAHLSTNVRSYYKRSRAWLQKNDGHAFSAPAIE
ncbi:MAG TPA: hypothetical protein VI488_05010 [Candidatus Angelobacter sp.]